MSSVLPGDARVGGRSLRFRDDVTYRASNELAAATKDTDADEGAAPSMDSVAEAPLRVEAHHLVSGLVASGSLMAASKMTALYRDPRSPGAPACGEDEGENIAEGVLLNVLRKVHHDQGMRRAYGELGRLTFRVVVLLIVVALQLGVFVRDYTVTFGAVRDEVFAVSSEVLSEVSAEDVRSGIVSWDVFLDTLDGVVGSIFKEEVCGDGICQWMDETPGWKPASYAAPYDAGGRDFVGCTSDCGEQSTTNVTVRFYDAWKVAEHTRLVEAVIASGEHCDNRGRCWELDAWQAKTPRAGWNLCHADDREFGVESKTVCVFDGDFFVDGLPFRAAELDHHAINFGWPLTLALYAGAWEVRYAFTGFVWTHPITRAPVQLGFPAVRGRVCWRRNIVDAPLAEECVDWGACPAAASCACEFVDNAYTCRGDVGRSRPLKYPQEVGDTRYDAAGYDAEKFAEYAGIEAVAAWWSVQGFTVVERERLTSFPYATLTSARATGVGDDAHEAMFQVITETLVSPFGSNGPFALNAGVRFTDLDVPKDALIVDAYVEFTSAAPSSGDSTVNYRAEASDHAAPFSVTTGAMFADGFAGITGRNKTDSVVLAVNSPWGAGEVVRSPGLAALVQEVVDRDGWVRGNALALIIEPTAVYGGTRAFRTTSFPGGGGPVLKVESGARKGGLRRTSHLSY